MMSLQLAIVKSSLYKRRCYSFLHCEKGNKKEFLNQIIDNLAVLGEVAMTFKQVVWKMAKVHYKNIFYTCSVIALSLCFSLCFLPSISMSKLNKLKAGILRLCVEYTSNCPDHFSMFFITYAHGIFIKRRKASLDYS